MPTSAKSSSGPGDLCAVRSAQRNEVHTIPHEHDCAPYCHSSATFASQTDALAGVDTLEAYTEWMKNLLTPLPDGTAEVRSFAVDEARDNVSVYGIFHGTHTGEGGPVPPTGRSAAADYVYVMDFDAGKIRHMTKI